MRQQILPMCIAGALALATTAVAEQGGSGHFNTENADMDYTSGTSLHVDLTIAQHLPLAGGFIGLGANASYYEQLTGDSGADARLGDFEGRTVGIGPVLSYVRPFSNGENQFLAELKWLPELDVEKRMKGDFIWFKFGCLF